MKIIFDEGLETERGIVVSNFNEHIMDHRITASQSLTVNADTVLPNISGLTENTNFTTIKILNKDDIEIALANTYNKILNASVNYYDESAQYQFNIIIGNEE